MDTTISRRSALTAGLTGAGVLALAACGSSGSDNGAGAPADTTSAASETSAAGSSAADTTSAPASSSGESTKAAAGGTSLAKLDDITVGEAVSAELDGKPVLVSRPTDTTAVCFSAICTHEGCTVAPAGKTLNCPCHQSVFNAETGAVISGPAPRALDTVAVSVENGEVVATA